jgi:hypothetical protein
MVRNVTNPAQQLHTLLTEWYASDNQLDVYKTRGGKAAGNLSFWRTHR